MGIPHSASFTPLSPVGQACSRGDLTAIHEILENLGYKDDEGVVNEVCVPLSSIFTFFFLFFSLSLLIVIVVP